MTTATAAPATDRHVGAFTTRGGRRKYWILLVSMLALASLSTLGLLAYNNPMEFGTTGFWLIAQRRLDSVIAMAVVAVSQTFPSLSFTWACIPSVGRSG